MTYNEVLADLTAKITAYVKPDLDPASVAAQLLDDKDAIDGEEADIELPARYAKAGNPMTFSVEMPVYE